jgi:hypothetical protein
MAQFIEKQGLFIKCAIDVELYDWSWFDVLSFVGLGLIIYSLYYPIIHKSIDYL